MIQRNLLTPLREHLSAPEITVITGPRQAGKTTLMRLLQKELAHAGLETLFFDLDFEADAQYFRSQLRLIEKIRLELGNQRGIVFIDEIQRKENASLFLKGIYDQKLPFKFVVSGSGSMALKAKIQESLAGRKRLFELKSVTFEEFVNFKTQYRYVHKLQEFMALEKDRLDLLLEEYMNFGGYPRIVTETRRSEKRHLMDEIFRSYVERDIVYLLGIDRPDVFISLVKLLSVQIGRHLKYTQLATHLGISVPTVKKYLWLIEKTFVIDRVVPFFRNPKKEITKAPEIYFHDLGLCNYAAGQFGAGRNRPDSGFLFQNFVYQLVRDQLRLSDWDIRFWRTTDKAEVDLILIRPMETIPVEVKFMDIKQKTIQRSLRTFIKKYHPQRAFVVNLSLEGSVMVDDTKVFFLPYHKLYAALCDL